MELSWYDIAGLLAAAVALGWTIARARWVLKCADCFEGQKDRCRHCLGEWWP